MVTRLPFKPLEQDKHVLPVPTHYDLKEYTETLYKCIHAMTSLDPIFSILRRRATSPLKVF